MKVILKRIFRLTDFTTRMWDAIENRLMNLRYLKLYKTITGKYYLPYFAKYDMIKNSIIKNEIFDKKVYEVGKKFIEADTIVLDIGSNYGQLSILYSFSNTNVSVYSFEADPYIFKILKKNVLINGSNIKTFNYLIENQNTENFIDKINLNSKNYFTYGSQKINIIDKNNFSKKKTSSVKSVKIDDIKFDKKISFMKIDTQGYDLKVLYGAKNTILNHKMPIIFEFDKEFKLDFKYEFKDFEDFIKLINYKIEEKIDRDNYLILPV